MSDDFFDLNERDASCRPWHSVEYEIDGETRRYEVEGSPSVAVPSPRVSWWRRIWRRFLRRPPRRPLLFLRFDPLDLPQDAVVTKATLNLRGAAVSDHVLVVEPHDGWVEADCYDKWTDARNRYRPHFGCTGPTAVSCFDEWMDHMANDAAGLDDRWAAE